MAKTNVKHQRKFKDQYFYLDSNQLDEFDNLAHVAYCAELELKRVEKEINEKYQKEIFKKNEE